MGRGTLLAHRNSIYIQTTTPKYVFSDKFLAPQIWYLEGHRIRSKWYKRLSKI